MIENSVKSRLRESVTRFLWKCIMRLEVPGTYQIDENGERLFIDHLLKYYSSKNRKKITVFDCGANKGFYAKRVLEYAKKYGLSVDLTMFEPQPDLNSVIKKTLEGFDGYQLVPAAVSSELGQIKLWRSEEGSALASLYERPGMNSNEIMVDQITLDTFFEKQTDLCLDLLKIDIEGHELSCLNGLGKFLTPQKIKVIQFEYGGCNLDSKVPLRDIFTKLQTAGYILAKIRPTGLSLQKYKPWHENYENMNYIAAPADFFESAKMI